MKKRHPEVYDVEKHEEFLQSIKDKFMNVLPYRDLDGCAILPFKFRNWNVQETSFSLAVHFMTCLVLMAADDVASQVCGIKVIADTNGITLSHLIAMQPKYLRLIAGGMKNAFPLRLKCIHVINDSTAVKSLWNIVSYALSEKINKRVRLHGSDGSSLAKYFDSRLLPKEYGGALDFDNSTFIKDAETRVKQYLQYARSGYR